MRKRTKIGLVFFSIINIAVAPFCAHASEGSREKVVATCQNALVRIERHHIASNREWFGSGIFYTPRRILTNAHIVGALPENVETFKAVYLDESDMSRVIFWVIFHGKKYRADFVGRDPAIDLAILETRVDISGVVPAVLGDSKKVKPLEDVVVCGNPHGYDNSFSRGTVSAKQRRIGLVGYEEYIQTDAAINPGNSGGPLVLQQTGEVVGVVNSKLPFADNIGFAVPINLFKEIEPFMKGTIKRGWIGIAFPLILEEADGFTGLSQIYELTGIERTETLTAIKTELFRTGGVLVTDVMMVALDCQYLHANLPNGRTGNNCESPAKTAGLIIGDIIKTFDNIRIKKSEDLMRAIFFAKPNVEATLQVLRYDRDGASHTITVKVTPSIRNAEGVNEGFY